MGYKKATTEELQAIAESILAPQITAYSDRVAELKAAVDKALAELHAVHNKLRRLEEMVRVTKIRSEVATKRQDRALAAMGNK